MRLSTLSVVCTTALVLPAAAAPLMETTKVVIPVIQATVTLEMTGPSEMPNVALPAMPTMPTAGRNAQVQRLSKAKANKLARLPRADFRQADYGVNHNVTLIQVPGPVQGVEATPSTGGPPASPMLSHRSAADWEADSLQPEYASTAAGSPSNSYAAAPDVSGSTGSGSAPAPAAGFPVALGDLTKAGPNNLPVHPDLSLLSTVAGQGVKTSGESRYKASYAAHDTLGALAQPAGAQSGGVPKTPAQLSSLGSASGLLRRVLAPARYFAAPLRRAFDLAKDVGTHGMGSHGVGAHTLELDTDALLPSRPDPNLNRSDPYIAQEEMRRKHAGVLNIDSNRAAPPPPPVLPTDTPLNGTDTKNATTTLTDGEKGAKNATALPVDDAAKTPLDKAEKKATKA